MKDLNDKRIENIIKREIDIPESFINVIENFGNKEKVKIKSTKKINKLNWKVAVLIIAIALPLSMPIIANTSKFLRNTFANDNLGVQKAVENNYIKNINMEYIKSNGLNLKAESIIMDNSNLNILLNYAFDNPISDIDNIFISDLNIKDENNNIIYTNNNEKEFLTKTVDWYRVESIDNTNAKQSLVFLSNNKFPKSKKLYISFSKVEISTRLFKKGISGSWSFEIELPEEFYNRSDIILSQKSESKNFKVLKAELSSTLLYIEVETPILDTYDRKYLALKENVILKDESGNKYEVGRNLETEDSSGKTILKFSFENITKYDSINKLYIEFKNNDQYEEIVLEK